MWDLTAQEFKALEEGNARQTRALWESARRICYYTVAMNSKKPPRDEAAIFRLPWIDGEYVDTYNEEEEAEALRVAQEKYDQWRQSQM